MINVSILLVGGDLDGQTFTALEGETSVRIHSSDNSRGQITDVHLKEQAQRRPEGHWYLYEQESEGSNNFVFKEKE